MKSIENNRAKLIELIDLKCGLLDELFAVGFLNERQMKSIKDEQQEAVQNQRLLNLMYSYKFC
jgi:ribosomal silencing factor RsfS